MPVDRPLNDTRLERRPRVAPTATTVGSFLVLGVFWGVWAIIIADVQRTFSLSYGALGIMLAVALAVAGVSGAVMSHVAERFGTGPMLWVSLAAWAVLMVGASLAPSFALFAVAFGATEVAGGCVDSAMNAAVSIRLAGRPGALVRFHSLFNAGALAGAAVAGLVLHAGISWRWLYPGVAVVAAGLALWVRRSQAVVTTPSAVPAPDDGALGAARRVGPVARLRADGLLLFLVVFAIAEITEGGVDTWGVLYLRTHLAAGVLLGAGAYVVGQGVATATRSVGGPVLGRLSARIALVVGGLVACAGILIESRSPQAVVAACGLALAAGGASLFWPLVMSEVTSFASEPTSAVGAFTASGYVGLVAGAPLVGWVSETSSLSRGLEVLAVLAFAVAVASFARPARLRTPQAG